MSDRERLHRQIAAYQNENKVLAGQAAAYEANAVVSDKAGEHALAAARRQCASDRRREVRNNERAVDRLRAELADRTVRDMAARALTAAERAEVLLARLNAVRLVNASPGEGPGHLIVGAGRERWHLDWDGEQWRHRPSGVHGTLGQVLAGIAIAARDDNERSAQGGAPCR